MPKKKAKKVEKCCGNWSGHAKSGGGCVYFLGFIGAAIYYISQSSGFWPGVLGFLKALIWPLFLVLEAFKFLGA